MNSATVETKQTIKSVLVIGGCVIAVAIAVTRCTNKVRTELRIRERPQDSADITPPVVTQEPIVPQPGVQTLLERRARQLETNRLDLLRLALRQRNEKEIRRLAQLMTEADLDEALDLVLKAQPKWKMLRAFLAAWSEENPKAAAAWITRNLPQGGDRAFALRQAVSVWTTGNPDEALEWAADLSAEQGRENALTAVFQTWAGIAPDTAASELESVQDFSARNLAIGTIAYLWALEDLRAATDWARNLPQDAGQTYALIGIGRSLRAADANVAAEWVTGLLPSYSDNPTVQTMAALLAGRDAGTMGKQSAAQIPAGTSEIDPSLALSIARWAGRDAQEAVAWAEQLPRDDSRAQALSVAAIAIARSNPQMAAGVIETMPAGAQKKSAASVVASLWAASDPGAATTWAGQLPQDGTSQRAMNGVQNTAAATANATRTADEVTQSPVGISTILSYDRSVSVELAEQLPDGPEREALMHTIAVDWAAEDPAAAASWAMEQMTDGRELNVTLRSIVWDWSERNSEDALAWANQLSDPEKQQFAVSTIAMELARSDPTAAAAVVATMPAGDRKKNTVINLAYQWALVNLDAATEWAEGLTPDDGREQALAEIQRASGR
jgi:hypothetical protein